MKKVITLGMLAAVAVSMVGCQSTFQDEWESKLNSPVMHSSHFKPVYNLVQGGSTVQGEAESSWIFWGLLANRPSHYARVDGKEDISTESAAVYDACEKAGASVLLAPRYRIVRKHGLLWFSGNKKVVVEGLPAKVVGINELSTDEAAKIRTSGL